MAHEIKIIISVSTRQMTDGINKANQSLGSLDKTIGRIMRTMTAFAALWAARKMVSGIVHILLVKNRLMYFSQNTSRKNSSTRSIQER